MASGDIWEQCIREAFDDAKLEATDEQIQTVTAWVDGQHENWGTSTGSDVQHTRSQASIEAEQRRKRQEIEDAHEAQIRKWKRAMAERLTKQLKTRVDEHDIWMDDYGDIHIH